MKVSKARDLIIGSTFKNAHNISKRSTLIKIPFLFISDTSKMSKSMIGYEWKTATSSLSFSSSDLPSHAISMKVETAVSALPLLLTCSDVPEKA